MPTLQGDRERLVGEINRLNLADDSDQLLFCHVFNEYFKSRQLIREQGAEWFWEHLLATGKQEGKVRR